MIQHTGNMIWVCRSGIIRGMAWIAISVYQLVIVIDVALHTLGSDMRACQGKFRCIVIERCRLPACGRVALSACLRIPLGDVIRIGRPGVISPMTIHTICGKT